MQDAGAKLTPKQEKAISALLGQPSIEAAAAAIGVNAATIYRWLHEPDLAGAYRLARWEVLQAAIERLHQASSTASEALIEIMEDRQNSAATRSRAAATVLEYSLRAKEVEDLEARIAALEQQMGGHQ